MDAIAELQNKEIQLKQDILKYNEERRDKDWSTEEHETFKRMTDELATIRETETRVRQQAERDDALQLVMAQAEKDHAVTRSEVAESRYHKSGKLTETTKAHAVHGWFCYRFGAKAPPQAEKALAEACGITGIDFRAKQDLEFRAQPYSVHHGHGMYSSTADGTLPSRFFDSPEHKEQRLNNNTGAGVGGELIPEGFVYELSKAMLAFGGLRRVCRIYSTPDGADYPWPVVDDTSNVGRIIAEQTDYGTAVEFTTSAVVLKAWKYTSDPIICSAELEQDSAFNLLPIIAELQGERIGRAQAAHFATGDDTGKPQGIAPGSTLGVTAGANSTVTVAEIDALMASLDPAWRTRETSFVFNAATEGHIMGLSRGSDDAQPLWQPSVQAGVPDRLRGKPYTVVQEMPDIAANQRPIVYGAMDQYIIRDAGGSRMYVMEEKYRELDSRGYVTFLRSDGRVLQPEALKHVLMPA